MAYSSNEFSQVISEELACPVCLEELKDPKNLNCPHNFCRECLEHMPKRSRKKIVCPLCKKHTAIPVGGVASLPTNVTLARLVEVTLESKAKVEIQKSLDRGKPEVNLLEKKISHFDKALRALVLDQKRVENDIHENVNQLIGLIRKQEASLCAEVVEFYDRQKVMIEREKNDLHKLYSDASKSVQEAEAILGKSSIDASKIRSVAETLAKQVETITQLMQEKSRLSIATLEKLEFKVNADADNHNSIFQHGKFGKLSKGILNVDSTSPVAASRSDYLSTLPSLQESEELRPKAVKPCETLSTGVTTRSQAKEIAANKPSSEPLQRSSSCSKVTKKSTKDNCYTCSKEATHYCESCDKRSCKDCIHIVTRLPCESYKEHHFVEGRPTSSKDQKNRCSFCDAKTPSHMCIYCRKHSCENCHNLYETDRCFSKESELHYFVDQESQKLSSERKEATSQKLATSVLKGNTPHPSSIINGENICDFCGLAANLICKPCLKPVCKTCVCVYEKDICPPTKKEHQFENIVAQSSNTNGTPHKDSDLLLACERCTFLNSPSHRICAVCATSRCVKEAEGFPESGTRRCANCTYGNEQGATVCKMCSCTIGLDRPGLYI